MNTNDKLTTKLFMAACGLTHPSLVTRLIKKGIVNPQCNQGDKHRTNYFSSDDVTAYYNYVQNKAANRSQMILRNTPSKFQVLAGEIQNLKTTLNTITADTAAFRADIENLKKIVKHLATTIATTKGNPQ